MRRLVRRNDGSFADYWRLLCWHGPASLANQKKKKRRTKERKKERKKNEGEGGGSEAKEENIFR